MSSLSTIEDDARVMVLLEDGDTDGALTLILELYGGRIFRMMMGVLHDESVAQDVFQDFSIALWKSLDNFQGNCRAYTWAYTIARRALGQRLRRPSYREARLSTREEERIQQWSRTATEDWRKTGARNRFQEMCEELDHDERTLVMLRIGEEMEWMEIAQIMADHDLDRDEAREHAVKLRKRFQRAKDKLRRQRDKPDAG